MASSISPLPPVCASLLCLLAGCFAGYDSRWGQQKQTQHQMAQAAKPADVEAARPTRPTGGAVERTLRVRLRPDAQYLATTVDAPKAIEALFEDANAVLVPSLGIALEVARLERWASPESPRLETDLLALRREDPGDGVDLVLGLVGAMPAATDSLHHEGMSTELGKHIVLRAAARTSEQELARTYAALDEGERSQLAADQRRHRTLVVLLHELGHCLGAVHEEDPESVMGRAYSPRMRAFGPAAMALMRARLDHDDLAGAARAQLDLLADAHVAGLVPADRQEEMDRLAMWIGQNRPEASPAAAPSGPPELSPSDRERLARAAQWFRAGDVGHARAEAGPLFLAYPKVGVVQDLRCQLAAVSWLPAGELQRECADAPRTGDAGVDSAR